MDPITMILMAVGGTGAAGVGLMHYLRSAPAGSRRNALYVLLGGTTQGGGGPGEPR